MIFNLLIFAAGVPLVFLIYRDILIFTSLGGLSPTDLLAYILALAAHPSMLVFLHLVSKKLKHQEPLPTMAMRVLVAVGAIGGIALTSAAGGMVLSASGTRCGGFFGEGINCGFDALFYIIVLGWHPITNIVLGALGGLGIYSLKKDPGMSSRLSR